MRLSFGLSSPLSSLWSSSPPLEGEGNKDDIIVDRSNTDDGTEPILQIRGYGFMYVQSMFERLMDDYIRISVDIIIDQPNVNHERGLIQQIQDNELEKNVLN